MEYKTKQVGEVEIILSKSKTRVAHRLVCAVCEDTIGECHKCGGLFDEDEDVLCDDNGHHWHIGCEKGNGSNKDEG